MSTQEGQTQYARLLAGLEDARWNHMRILADAAEEEGNLTLAAGWRWLAEHQYWPEQTADWMGAPRKLTKCFKWSAWDSHARTNINIDVLLSRHGNTISLPMPVLRLVKSPLVELVKRENDFYQLSMLCESPITLLELTAQAAGEWLASQKKEG
jgi:hypothetical protein